MRSTPNDKPGKMIGNRYRVHHILAGGMGMVYLCFDQEERESCALKTFKGDFVVDMKALPHVFKNEVSTWIALKKHPNIVRCYYMQTVDGQPYMVLEWVAGDGAGRADLRYWIRNGALVLQSALQIALDVCNGLLYAQELQPGLVHHDLKPENILITQEGLAKVTDFGLAQMVQSGVIDPGNGPAVEVNGRQTLLRKRGFVGTPIYAAPEQWQGAPTDGRTDVYALGCILYEMFSGRPPFIPAFQPSNRTEEKQWLRAMRAAHESAPVPALPAGVPDPVVRLIHACLAKSSVDRPSVSQVSKWLSVSYFAEFGQLAPRRPAPGEFTAADYNNRGNTYDSMQMYAEAIDDYSKAVALDPDSALYYSNRGLTYHYLGRCKKALQDYKRAIKRDPRMAEAYLNRGLTFYAQKRYKKALASYSQAIRLDPRLILAYYSRGDTYYRLELYEQALRDYTSVIQLDPENAAAFRNRGSAALMLEKYDQAMADFRRAIELKPQSVAAYLDRGQLLGQVHGRWDLALLDFEQAARLGSRRGAQYADKIRQSMRQ
ncbi:MAG: serine/threonine-protein kinase [Candidatus Promineifilaceae bacterium]|nr:serine/threonine-protein kinase [Candidatus Promineifilaceae bacterium]